jgi:hypothetical protein
VCAAGKWLLSDAGFLDTPAVACKHKDSTLTTAERRNWNKFVATQTWMIESFHQRIKKWMCLKTGWRARYHLLSRVYYIVASLTNFDIEKRPLERVAKSARRAVRVALSAHPAVQYRCPRCRRLEQEWMTPQHNAWVQCHQCRAWLCEFCAPGFATDVLWQCVDCTIFDTVFS